MGAQASVKRKVFISYHHSADQAHYDNFSRVFGDAYEVFTDKSLERAYQSDNTDYIRWQISQNDIAGTSCTIVLCGMYTHQRKYVDWEIKSSLDKNHGIVGIWLPTLPQSSNGGTVKPDRLQDNVDSKYAKWIAWNDLTADLLKETIEAAIACPKYLIVNTRPLRQRNG